MNKKLLLLVVLSLFLISANAKPRYPDSLWHVWNSKTVHDTSRLKAMGRMIHDYYLIAKNDSVKVLCDLQFALAVKLNDEKTQSDIYHTQARLYAYTGDIRHALELYEKSLAIKERIRDETGIAATMNNMGKIYLDQGLNEKAITCFFTSLRIREKMKDEKGRINVLGNIGNAYNMQKNPGMAIRYISESMKLCREFGDKRGEAMGYMSIGMVYYSIFNSAEAANNYRKGLAIAAGLNDYVNQAKLLLNLGEAHNSMRNFDSASYYFGLSLDIRKQIHDTIGIAKSLNGLAAVALNTGRIQDGIRLGEQSLAILESKSLVREKIETCRLLYMVYERTGNYAKALIRYKQFVQISNIIESDKTKNILFREEIKYELEKKSEIEKRTHQLALARLNLAREQERARKNAWMQLLGSLCVLLLLGVYFIYNRSRQRKIIAGQKANLLKQKLLVSQLNPHFIFNSLNAVQQYIYSQNSHDAGMYLSRFSELMRMILDFSREDFIPVESELHFIKEYLELQQLRFPERFRYVIETDPAIDVTALQIPPMIAQPFIENAVEHGISRNAANGIIHIRLFFENNTLCYEIEDNGIGLEAAARNERKTKHRSLATTIVRERLDALQDDGRVYSITITDKTAAGSSGVLVRMTIPFTQ